MGDLLRESRLKVDRAEKHISDIRTTILDLQCSYTSTVEHDPESRVVSLKYDSLDAPRLVDEITLTFGDAIHNLRTALDYAWIVVMRRIDPAVDIRYLKFPFKNSLQELNAALTGRNIDVTAPGLFNGIRAVIKPYRGGNDSLCRLHDLDIADKHLLLTPMVTYSSISEGSVEDESGRPHEVTTHGIEGHGPFYVPINSGYKIKNHGHFSLTVLFDQGAAVPQRWDVLAVLEEIPNHVMAALRNIESWI